jgi:hypothetical protein
LLQVALLVVLQSSGAIAGELGCARGWMHAFIYHPGAGVVIVAACVPISRAHRVRSAFAPRSVR